MQKPSNLPPASSALWDTMEKAAAAGGTGMPIGIGMGTPGMVHYLAVERCLQDAATANQDPVDWANSHVAEIAAYYELLVAALKAAGFGTNSPILDTTRPLFDQGVPLTVSSANTALQSLPDGTSVVLTLKPATVQSLMAAGMAGKLDFLPMVDLFMSIGKGKKK